MTPSKPLAETLKEILNLYTEDDCIKQLTQAIYQLTEEIIGKEEHKEWCSMHPNNEGEAGQCCLCGFKERIIDHKAQRSRRDELLQVKKEEK